MAIVTFYDRIGRGGVVRANDYSIFPSDQRLNSDGNERFSDYDYNTFLVSGSLNNGEYRYGIYIDYINSTTASVQSLYLFDSSSQSLISIYDVNIRFNVNDNFSSGVTYTNMYSSNDQMTGNRYADYIEAGAGYDTIYGNGGNDTLRGDAGSDMVIGNAGQDILFGGSGDDSVYGGTGRDTYYGGSGGDRFVFEQINESGIGASVADVLMDFDRRYDWVALDLLDASAVLTGNNRFVFRGRAQFTTSAEGEVRYQRFDNAGTNNDYTMIFVDNDRDVQAEMSIRIRGLVDLRDTDFIL